MRQFGLIGYPLSHSFSPGYFQDKFKRENITNANYTAFPLQQIDQVKELVKQNPSLAGINVTIPYKQSIIPYLHQLSDEAAAIGAVNTVKFTNNGWLGYNTDAHGFMQSLLPCIQNKTVKGALVLGTGGASKAVVYVLQKLDIPFLLVSRNKTTAAITYDDIDEVTIEKHQLIINTTPLGMSPNVKNYPTLPYESLDSSHILYDLIYNPEETEFMKKGIERGSTVKNGLEMLHLQAEKSWDIWNMH